MRRPGKSIRIGVESEQVDRAGSEIVDCGVIPDSKTIHEWPVLLVLAATQFVHILDFMMIMPLGPEFIRLYGISAQQFGFLVTVYTFSAALCSFMVAFVIDHFDRKYALICFCVGFILATLFCAASWSYTMLLCSRAVAGMFGGLMSAAIFSIIADLIPESRRGTATGTVMSSFSLAAVVGMPMGLLLANWLSWRIPFVTLALLTVLIIVAAYRYLPVIKAHGQHSYHSASVGTFSLTGQLKSVFMNRNHIVAFSLISVVMFSSYLVIPFIGLYMISNVGMYEHELPYLYFIGGLCTFFTANLFGRFTDRYGQRLMFGILAAMSMIPILWVTHITEASLVLMLAATTLFMVLVTGRVIPLMALITVSVRPHLRGSFMTFHMSIQQLSAGLGSLIAGSIMQITAQGQIMHYDSVGLFAAVITLFSIVLIKQLKTTAELDAQ